MKIIILIIILLLCIILALIIHKKLVAGKKAIINGRATLKKFDNFFVRLFAGKKIKQGYVDLFKGEEQYKLWSIIRLLLVILAVAMLIFLIKVIIGKFVG